MITVFATFSFEAAHYLPRVPEGHKCGRMHGHNWTVEIHVEGKTDGRGWIIDFYDIERAWRQIYERIDHRVLNEIRGLENPTTETIVEWIATQLRDRIDNAYVRVKRVVLRETPAFGAIYEAG